LHFSSSRAWSRAARTRLRGAVRLELQAEGITFEQEKRYPVFYRDCLLCEHRVDLIVANQLVLEIKSVEQLASVHRGQV
jgi:GxxExxY protein